MSLSVCLKTITSRQRAACKKQEAQHETDRGNVMFTKHGNKPLFPTAAGTTKPPKKRKVGAIKKTKSKPIAQNEGEKTVEDAAPKISWFNPLWSE
jgi:hypothetical protein